MGICSFPANELTRLPCLGSFAKLHCSHHIAQLEETFYDEKTIYSSFHLGT